MPCHSSTAGRHPSAVRPAVAVEELADVHGPVAGAPAARAAASSAVSSRAKPPIGRLFAEHAVVVGVLAGVEGRARGAAERVVHEAVREGRAPLADQRAVFGIAACRRASGRRSSAPRCSAAPGRPGRGRGGGRKPGRAGAWPCAVNTGDRRMVRCRAADLEPPTRYARGSLGFRIRSHRSRRRSVTGSPAPSRGRRRPRLRPGRRSPAASTR